MTSRLFDPACHVEGDRRRSQPIGEPKPRIYRRYIAAIIFGIALGMVITVTALANGFN